MNAVEIDAAVSDLAAEPFDPVEFPFQFLAAFDKKETQLKRLRKGDTNRSDVPGGVLLQANIHMAVCAPGATRSTLEQLKSSPKTVAGRAKFVLATDGEMLEAEDLISHEAIASEYPKFAEHIGFFLPLAGISTVREIKDNPIDVRATGRLNKLYVELLRQNPEWGTDTRRHDMNHFMARLIFCFFAEDTNIFRDKLFTSTIEQYTESDGSNTHSVLETLFRTMNLAPDKRDVERMPGWASNFPYVNGGLFSDSAETPKFTRIARSYLLQAGSLDWQHINPDIFGSMIQAVADEGERGALGMHYTSVPNILKVLNPLFLDDLRAQLSAAGSNTRALRKLRERLSRIRVFDPACGSGNFLVIAYKQMREIEAAINSLLGERPGRSVIPLDNFRGIEIRDFAVEIARLALVIAEYQSNVLYLGQEQAHIVFLPLSRKNWITWGNALRLDWLQVCPTQGTGVKLVEDDLFQTPLEQPAMDFENEGGETYICGNPPYVGDKFQNVDQKSDLRIVLTGRNTTKAVDYIAGWFWKASDFIRHQGAFAFVSTNSICQGVQVPAIWTDILDRHQSIFFAHQAFHWANSASNNANVMCIIVGVRADSNAPKFIYSQETRKVASNISPYLIDGPKLIVQKQSASIFGLPMMFAGNIPRDQGNFMLTQKERSALIANYPDSSQFVRRIVGSDELINGLERFCLWIKSAGASEALKIPAISERLDRITTYRRSGSERGKLGIDTPWRFERTITGEHDQIIVPRVSSERREYLPVGFTSAEVIVSDAAMAIYDVPVSSFSLLASRLHWIWVRAICGQLETRIRYSNTLGWNTFPVPQLTEGETAALTRCAEDILLAREAHFPATIADLYDPENMPANLRAAHEANDQTLEQIYIGRRFKNDTERLEKLFEMYAQMTGKQDLGNKQQGAASKRKRSPKADRSATLRDDKEVLQ
jgi:hypothetical protein